MKVRRKSDEYKQMLRDVKTELTRLIDKPELELTVISGMIGDETYRVDIGKQMTLKAYTAEEGVQSFPVIIITINKSTLRLFEVLRISDPLGFERTINEIYNESIKNKLG
tara:strand:- start:2368 stop:2697 length:330 start_codon:yes stop_codon:yes gene_type:complete